MGATSTTFPRDAAAVLEDRLRRAPVVVLTGARQTGKSTLVRSRRGDAARRSMTLGSLAALDQARSTPRCVHPYRILEPAPDERSFRDLGGAHRAHRPSSDDPARTQTSVLADDRAAWFDAYVETYVQRDVRESARIGDLPAFARLVRLLSLRNGGLVNYADLASDCGLPRTTVQRWVALLETSYLATVLPPYFESSAKRLIKTPKLYTLDTGLGLHLAGVETKTDLKSMQQRGVWLEQLVLNDLLVWRDLELRKPQVYFYRTAGGEEIDFVVAKGRRFLPIEIKASTAPRTSDAKTLESFCTESGPRAAFGLLLYDGPEAYRHTEHVVAVPLRCIF